MYLQQIIWSFLLFNNSGVAYLYILPRFIFANGSKYLDTYYQPGSGGGGLP